MSKPALFLALCGLFAAGGARADNAAPDAAALFAYDAKAPLELHEVALTRSADGVATRDVTFKPLPDAAPVRAYVVKPACKHGCAGVLWVHWLGEPKTTNRDEFLAEAQALAKQGVASVLVDAMWSAPEWYEKRDPEQDYDNSRRQVIALRRALDLLAAEPGVDRARLALVGHDYGGMYGMIAAGSDKRAKTCVFAATTSSLANWAFFARQPASKVEYIRRNAVFELTDYLHALGDTSVLFQFANRDVYVSRAETSVLAAAVPGRKERKFYDAEHDMKIEQAATDRAAWLTKELGLAPAAEAPAKK